MPDKDATGRTQPSPEVDRTFTEQMGADNPTPVTNGMLAQVMDVQVEVAQKSWRLIGALENRCAALEKRLTALEAQPKGLQYQGIHQSGCAYDKGDSVTRQGSLWVALEKTRATPGEGASAWALAVKRGRDGKDYQP